MLGGHKIERSKYVETARDRIVWVASPAEGAPPIPVRLEIETAYGSLMGHLTGFATGLQAPAKLQGKELRETVDSAAEACHTQTVVPGLVPGTHRRFIPGTPPFGRSADRPSPHRCRTADFPRAPQSA